MLLECDICCGIKISTINPQLKILYFLFYYTEWPLWALKVDTVTESDIKKKTNYYYRR